MKIGFVGLGRMGKNMVYNLLDHKHEVVAYNRNVMELEEAKQKGVVPAYTLEELVSKLETPRVVWLMITAKAVDEVIEKLIPLLSKGDLIIDGGNSYFEESKRRHAYVNSKGLDYLDVGTSGGMEGARNGACMMVGGKREVFEKVEPAIRDMCVPSGYGYMGRGGAGHFVKMVHNGIEYGMMAAMAEGIAAIQDKSNDFGIDMNTVVKTYAHGSIIESRLMSWLEKSYFTQGYMDSLEGTVPPGETESEMENLTKLYPMKILEASLDMRRATRTKPSLEGKVNAALRNQFGGHAVVSKK